MKQTIRILGIETSCDETAAAIVENGRHILSHLVASQIAVHQQFGGVVPEIASRKHIEVIASLVDMAFSRAGLKYQDIDAVAVTNTPGLIGALLVGVSFAKALAYGLDKPVIAVNHLKAHIFANFLENKDELLLETNAIEGPGGAQDQINRGHPGLLDSHSSLKAKGAGSFPDFPAVCLVVSGGHTSLLYMEDYRYFEVMGETRDDAAGEAFDKVARFLGLGYPGGPAVEMAAQKGRPGVYSLPRVFLDRNDYEFSFSGLKTATMNLWNKIERQGNEASPFDLAAEFQAALVEVLVEKTITAAISKNVRNILVAGGVAANSLLRHSLKTRAMQNNLRVYLPPPALCTDNAAMVGCAGYYQYLEGDYAGWDLNAFPNFELVVKKACG